jgi:hypothetical protein
LLDYHILNNDDNKYADLTKFTTVTTREGDDLVISNANGMTINGAKVLGSKAYDHGVVYVIDKVLIPAKVADQLAKDMNKNPSIFWRHPAGTRAGREANQVRCRSADCGSGWMA